MWIALHRKGSYSCPFCCRLADDYFEPQSSPFDDFLVNKEVELQPVRLRNVFKDDKGMI